MAQRVLGLQMRAEQISRLFGGYAAATLLNFLRAIVFPDRPAGKDVRA
jgi:hypothetical protein